MKIFKMAVAIDHQHHEFKPFVRPPRCKLQSYSHLDPSMLEFSQTNLTNSFKNAFYQLPNIQKSFSTPCLSLTTKDEDIDSNPRIEIIGGHGAPRARALVVEAAIAVASGVKPEPVASGLGGAYFLCSQNGDKVAVVKPIDEEPLAFNNPKGFAGRMLGQPGLKRSIMVGETGFRELAAYLLDHDGFAGVPTTALVKISHVKFHVNNSESIPAPIYKIASLQRFVDHESDAGDLGPSGFSVTSVHRIGILDIRILNLDRHAGNLLVKHGYESYAAEATELVPIDHGLCLPEALDDPYFEWMHWPQASIPFSESEVEYISKLDPFKEAEILRKELPNIRESSIRVLVICTIFLKQAVAAGLCLGDIGEMMTREFCGGEESWSVLENLCVNARASMISKTIDGNDYHGTTDPDSEEDREMFQFDDCDSTKVPNVPQLLQSSPRGIGIPPKIPRYLSVKSMSGLNEAVLSPLPEQSDNDICTSHDENISLNNEEDEDSNTVPGSFKVGGIMRSMSFSVHKCSNDGSGGISFEKIKEEEWESFLGIFEQLLPEAFEDRKSLGSLKQRLGTSCEF